MLLPTNKIRAEKTKKIENTRDFSGIFNIAG